MLRSFQARLFMGFVLATSLLAAVFLGLAFRHARLLNQRQVEAQLLTEARLAAPPFAAALRAPNPKQALAKLADEAGRATQDRVTVIGADGWVLADSEVGPAGLPRLENHARRPELLAAAAAGWGSATRRSVSVNHDLLYVALALPAAPGAAPAYLRLAKPLSAVQDLLWSLKEVLLLSAGLGLALALLLSWLLARLVAAPLKGLAQAAGQMASGDLDLRLPLSGIEELKALQGSFARMALSLRESFGKLESERDLLGATFAGMREAVLALDGQGCITLLNPAAEALLGQGASALKGRHHLEALRNSDLIRLLERARASGQTASGEVLLTAPGRPEAVLSGQAAPLFGGGIVVVLTDITELKRLLRVRQEFTANVSHELKTPLTAILGFSETLLDGALKEPRLARSFVRKIQEQGRSLQALIADLLDLNKAETRGLGESLDPLEALAACREAAKRSAAKARGRKSRVAVEAPKGLKALAGRAALAACLGNLLDNAVKYSPAGSLIRLSASPVPGGWVRFEVADPGEAIPAEALPRLFERFYRVDASRSRATGGTGLGLALVKHLAEKMGGRVGVAARAGEGNRFWLDLPAA